MRNYQNSRSIDLLRESQRGAAAAYSNYPVGAPACGAIDPVPYRGEDAAPAYSGYPVGAPACGAIDLAPYRGEDAAPTLRPD